MVDLLGSAKNLAKFPKKSGLSRLNGNRAPTPPQDTEGIDRGSTDDLKAGSFSQKG